MTAIPSPHRLRTKTSDIADFFRASSSKSRATDVDGPPSPTLLSDPEFSLVPKRSSKIPFLGRQRTKSIQSDASTSASSAGSSRRPADSDVRRSNVSSRTELRLDVPAVPSLDDTLERPLPALPGTPTPPLTSASPSLGSKLAARFAPSRQKFLNLSPRKAPRPSNDDASDTLVSSATPSRGTSVDSTATGHRSTTPRPTHPTITVSLPPDNLEGYEGMFTLPTPTSSAPIDDPQLTPTSPTPPIRFPDADTTVKRRSSRAATAERSSSRASRISRKHVGTTFKRTEVDSTDAEDSEAVMSDSPKPSPPMNAGPTPTAEKRRTLATMPYNYSSEKAPPRFSPSPSSHQSSFFRPPSATVSDIEWQSSTWIFSLVPPTSTYLLDRSQRSHHSSVIDLFTVHLSEADN
ncbi:hypothetical protein C8R47DRAFT_1208306 [Mycena vitilis]|nr:hypothetical protein C8R47DRAFT_1208306 [Mycena vitilis]